jgi:hypothetical protein
VPLAVTLLGRGELLNDNAEDQAVIRNKCPERSPLLPCPLYVPLQGIHGVFEAVVDVMHNEGRLSEVDPHIQLKKIVGRIPSRGSQLPERPMGGY